MDRATTLTEPQLQRLTAISEGREHGYGMALMALERKGLVEPVDDLKYEYRATEAGVKALKEASCKSLQKHQSQRV